MAQAQTEIEILTLMLDKDRWVGGVNKICMYMYMTCNMYVYDLV